MLTVGSLFSGIGGIDLGLERLGMKVLWQVEIDKYCQKVLKKHWPKVERFEDVTKCGGHNLRSVDVICGGFPCQDVSTAGKRAGIEGARSGLWSEFARIIHELGPKYVFVENVTGLLSDGMGRVLGDLAEIGYDVEWQVLSAASVGAPHLRERIWIIAYPSQTSTARKRKSQVDRCSAVVGRMGTTVFQKEKQICNPNHEPEPDFDLWSKSSKGGWWEAEPNVGRVVDGVSRKLDTDRLKALGNAVVPQCVEVIGQRILGLEQERTREAI